MGGAARGSGAPKACYCAPPNVGGKEVVSLATSRENGGFVLWRSLEHKNKDAV